MKFTSILIVAFVLVFGVSQKVFADDKSEIFVSNAVNEALEFLSDSSLSKAQKAAKFKTFLTRNFDLDAIAKFAVGRYWRQMTPAEKREYTALFKDLVVGVYTERFDEYSGQSVIIKNSLVLENKDHIVKSSVVNTNGAELVGLDWRVRPQGSSGYKIIDVIVAGVSMAVTQRSDFSSVIQRGGGNPSVLIDHLKK